MHETAADLLALQQLLDASYARAGAHLRSIWGPETRLGAERLSAELPGVQVLDLATVTPRGEPRVAPVDGLFFRGRFWFGSAEDSLRFRNIRANPAVSGAVTKGLETFLVIVHGRAVRDGSPRARGGRLRGVPARGLRLRLGRRAPGRAVRVDRRAHAARVQAVSVGHGGAAQRGLNVRSGATWTSLPRKPSRGIVSST